mmetsp:Transcript_26768/g.77183  ORF Transcript_26768/g.77183 Transcript_26768/m.77183 type:complete len:322 (-) Transcript_26768:22-987(-)
MGRVGMHVTAAAVEIVISGSLLVQVDPRQGGVRPPDLEQAATAAGIRVVVVVGSRRCHSCRCATVLADQIRAGPQPVRHLLGQFAQGGEPPALRLLGLWLRRLLLLLGTGCAGFRTRGTCTGRCRPVEGTARRCCATTATATAGSTTKHFFKHGKGIESTPTAIKVELLTPTSAGEATTKPSKAGGIGIHTLLVSLKARFPVFVIYFPLLVVAQDCIRLGDLDELCLVLLLLFVAAILTLIWMVLQRQLLVCLLDFFAAGALPQTKDGVVISALLSLLLPPTALLLPPSAVLGARALEEQDEDQRRGQHRRTPLHCSHGGL